MKIIVSSQGEKLDSLVDPRFGRAAQFIHYDMQDSSYAVISNAQSLEAAQGAGIKAAETISRLGAQVLITGHCGPKALETLKAAAIDVIPGAEGCTIAEALEKYKSGQLKPATFSDVSGHWQ